MNNKAFENFINQDFSGLADWIYSLNAYEFSLLAAAIGFALAPILTVNQQNSLGNFFELTGQVLLTINAQNTTLNQYNNKSSTITKNTITNYEDEINKLKDEVIKLRNDCMSNK